MRQYRILETWKFVINRNPARAKHPYLVGHILVLISRLASRLVSLDGRGHMRLGSGQNHNNDNGGNLCIVFESVVTGWCMSCLSSMTLCSQVKI